MSGAARRAVLVRLALAGPAPRIDVGADHGRVAEALGCIATEREPSRRGRPNVPWVIADGLQPFRAVGTAVIAGMGARTILHVVEQACPVERLVLHAQDDPGALRLGLGALGWRVADEALAPDGRGFAEVVVAVRGPNPHDPLDLELGPVLLRSSDPLRPAWLTHRLRELDGVARKPELPLDVRERLAARIAVLQRARTQSEGPNAP